MLDTFAQGRRVRMVSAYGEFQVQGFIQSIEREDNSGLNFNLLVRPEVTSADPNPSPAWFFLKTFA